MEERYEYRHIRIERGAWGQVAEAVHGDCARAVQDAGGNLFGLWRGEIGWPTDEGVVMTAWPPNRDPEPTVLDAIPGVRDSTVERLVATVRPVKPDPPKEDGIYAHRWFELDESNWDEFLELSHTAWPDFERTFEGIRIVGFWRADDVPPPTMRILLLTRYPSLAAWEASRTYTPKAPAGARPAFARFRRRAELTDRTIVRIARLVPSA